MRRNWGIIIKKLKTSHENLQNLCNYAIEQLEQHRTRIEILERQVQPGQLPPQSQQLQLAQPGQLPGNQQHHPPAQPQQRQKNNSDFFFNFINMITRIIQLFLKGFQYHELRNRRN